MQNISDVSIVAETLSLCLGQVNAMVKGLVFIRNRQRLRRIFIALQRNVDKSIFAGMRMRND